MGKTNVYLLVTDLHFDFSKANRIDYLGEVLQAMEGILNIQQQYASRGNNVHLILLGDVFDGSLPNSSDALQGYEIMRFFCSNFVKTYAVVGNHEITYARDNPFWFLVSCIADESLASIRRYIQPRGMNNTIMIPDTITDGNVKFYFNHFGIPAKTPEHGGTNIGVFHQNVGSNDICTMWGTFDDVEDASYIQAYNYCFFGHMHLAKGKYYLNESHSCIGEWLGAIGRTKVTEIDDNSLSVNIPAVVVKSGELECIDDNYITLRSYHDSVDVIKLNAAEKSKKLVEESKCISSVSFKGETLYKTLELSFSGTYFGFLLSFLNRSEYEIITDYKISFENPETISEEEEQSNG